MKKIKLTQGKFALVDDELFDEINQYVWYAHSDYNTFYADRKVITAKKEATLAMHRVIMNTPKGMMTDHIDGNGLNNQRSNLRVCTNSQNQQNRRISKHSTSGFKGVSWNRCDKKWRGQIKHHGVYFYLGNFDSKIEAAKAYDKKAKELFGEFAYLNFP